MSKSSPVQMLLSMHEDLQSRKTKTHAEMLNSQTSTLTKNICTYCKREKSPFCITSYTSECEMYIFKYLQLYLDMFNNTKTAENNSAVKC